MTRVGRLIRRSRASPNRRMFVQQTVELPVNGSHERESSPGRSGRGRRPEQGRISKMFDADGLDHYWDTSLARFKEKNDVDI